MSTTVTYETPDRATLLTPAQRALDSMHALVIDSPEMAQIAADERGKINQLLKDNQERRLAIIRGIDAAKEPVNSLFRPVLDVLAEAREVVDEKLVAYRNKVEAERREAERKAAEEQRRRQAQAEAEAARIAAEAEAAAQKLRDEAAAAAAAGQVGAAAKLEAQAEEKIVAAEIRAEDRMAKAAEVVPVVPVAPKIAGMSTPTLYSAECDDIMALAAYVVANPMFKALLTVDKAALNAQARSLRDAFALPGCKLVKTTNVRSQRGA